MRRFLLYLRSWLMSVVLVCVAALLTVPWTAWVIVEVYERDVKDRANLVATRVKILLADRKPWLLGPNSTWQEVGDALRVEMRGDSTVQAVWIVDYPSGTVRVVSRHVVGSPPDPESLLKTFNSNVNPDIYRQPIPWEGVGRSRGFIYVDFSRAELQRHFRESYWPLLKKLAALTAVGFIVISSTCLIAYHLWGRATWQRKRSELQQQGLLAERVLTAAVLAHEIRNPLAALRFQIHSLRRNSADSDRVTATADTIDSELSRIQKLVQDYLAHEKAQAMSVMVVDLKEVIGAIKTLMEDLLRSSGTALVIQSAKPVRVMCDPHGLRQVLMNLVINAQQAMGQGGVVSIQVGQEGNCGLISVSDTGPGIPEEMKDRLFKPFATSKKEGSGIGLALVKRFVDNFGGSVTVESEPGRGATFVLKLPLDEGTEARRHEGTKQVESASETAKNGGQTDGVAN